MTPQVIHAEIASLDRQVTQLEIVRAQHAEALARALAVESRFYSESDVGEARVEKERVERRIGRITERIAALEAQLPTPEQVAAADAPARLLAQRAEQACTKLAETWPRFIPALEAAESIARELTAARREADTASAHLTDLVRQFDLDVHVPEQPTPSALDGQLATHLAALLVDVAAGGEPRDVVELYLHSTRAERQRRSEPVVTGATIPS